MLYSKKYKLRDYLKLKNEGKIFHLRKNSLLMKRINFLVLLD